MAPLTKKEFNIITGGTTAVLWLIALAIPEARLTSCTTSLVPLIALLATNYHDLMS